MSETTINFIEMGMTVLGAGIAIYASIKVSENKIATIFDELNKIPAFIEGKIKEVNTLQNAFNDKIRGDLDNLKAQVKDLDVKLEKDIINTYNQLETRLSDKLVKIEKDTDTVKLETINYRDLLFNKFDSVKEKVAMLELELNNIVGKIENMSKSYVERLEMEDKYINKELYLTHAETNNRDLDRLRDDLINIKSEIKDIDNSLIELIVNISKYHKD